LLRLRFAQPVLSSVEALSTNGLMEDCDAIQHATPYLIPEKAGIHLALRLFAEK